MSQSPANWHPDPFGRHDLRYWDCHQWTHHVSSRGLVGIDPPTAGPAAPLAPQGSNRIQRQVARAGVDGNAQVGGGSFLTEPVLVVNQKAKLIEINAEYAVFNQHGQRIGAVREVGRSVMKNMVSPLSNSNRTHRLQIIDHLGQVQMTVTRPAKMVRSKVIVRGANGVEIGQIAQKNLGIIRKIRFSLESGGRTVGSIEGEDWSAWDFSIRDTSGDEVARITKTWAGLAREWFTKADRYVVEIHRPVPDPLRSLVVAAALAVDTALRQPD